MIRSLLCLLIGLAYTVNLTTAQDVTLPSARWSAPTQPVLIGEPFILELEIILPPDSELIAPALPGVWGAFWVMPLVPSEVIQREDGSRLYRQAFNATLWSTGQFATPVLTLGYRSIGQGNEQTLQLAPVVVQVNSILNADDLNLRPMRPSLAMPYLSPLMLAAGAGAVLGGAYGVWRLIHQYYSPGLTTVPSTPARLALDELNRLTRLEDSVRVHIRVADVLRRFIGARSGLSVMDMTTEELLQQLPPAYLPEASRLELQQLLDYADLVKFAQVKPGAGQRIIGVARRWVSEIESRDHA